MMFAFRCYACGATLGRGLPPLDALSTDQIEQVDGVVFDDETNAYKALLPFEARAEQKMKAHVLDNTKFEGMSAGSFCAFCLVRIQDFPGATGRIEFMSIEPIPMVDEGPYRNRQRFLLEIREMYKAADLSLLESLLFEGITYTDIPCWFPECTNTERILLPEDQAGCHLHRDFLACFQILRTERDRWEFHSMGHAGDCECWSCNEIRWDDEAWRIEAAGDAAEEHRDGCHDDAPDPTCPLCPKSCPDCGN